MCVQFLGHLWGPSVFDPTHCSVDTSRRFSGVWVQQERLSFIWTGRLEVVTYQTTEGPDKVQ
jgi:hypothetical protein